MTTKTSSASEDPNKIDTWEVWRIPYRWRKRDAQAFGVQLIHTQPSTVSQLRVEWFWGHFEDKAFSEIKHLGIQAPILAYYHANMEIVIQCYASSLGLGAFLMQEVQSLADAIRALTVPKTPKRPTKVEGNPKASFSRGHTVGSLGWYC